MGFSQGGAIALHVALRSPVPLGGCVALSTWLPLRSEYPKALSPHARSVKILQIHGSGDQMVPQVLGLATHNILRTFITSPQPKFINIDGMGHIVDQNTYSAIKHFLNEEVGFHFMRI